MRHFILLLAAAFLLPLVGCGHDEAADSPSSRAPAPAASEEEKAKTDSKDGQPKVGAAAGGKTKFDFDLEDWKYTEVAGTMVSSLKIGMMQVRMTTDAKKTGGGTGPATATVTLEKEDGEYTPTAFTISFQGDDLSCGGRPGQEGHELTIDIASTDPFKGELSGEIACGERGADEKTWVKVSGRFDENGL